MIGAFKQLPGSYRMILDDKVSVKNDDGRVPDTTLERRNSVVSSASGSVKSAASDISSASFDDNQNKMAPKIGRRTSADYKDDSKEDATHKLKVKRASIDDKTSSVTSVKGLIKKFAGKSFGIGDKGSVDLQTIKVERLPQVFIVKYLGKRECHGLWGLKEVRKPVDEMVQVITEQLDDGAKSVELPLLYAVVSHKGLDLRAHQNNKVYDPEIGLIPIDFISYGVQDVKFWRIFSFIVVQEMSSRSKKLECHAFVCDTPVSARSVALSLSAAFKVYRKQLETQGQHHRFRIELRPPDELENEEEDC